MLTCQKHLFSLPSDRHYLNCAYMSPLALSVEAAGLEGLRRKRDPSSITPAMFFKESDEARRLFARLVGVVPSHVALIPSASYGLATVARNVAVHRGQNLVVMFEQFPSNVYTWKRLAAENNAELRTVGPSTDSAAWDEQVCDAVDADTALVAMSAVHWTDGTRFDLAAVGQRAREVGAAFVIDATQSAGALDIDAAALQVDALVCAAYKWLLGPYSMGAVYLGPRFAGGIPLEETWIGRQGSHRFAGLVQYQDAYQPGAIRYDVGERSNFILLPMMIAGLRQVLQWQPAGIQFYLAALTHDLVCDARVLGYRISDASARAAHLFGIRRPEHVTLARLNSELLRRNISVSLRGDAIRVSPHVYNNDRDISALREALEAATRPERQVTAPDL